MAKEFFLREDFECWETCNNGNERKVRKSVYCKPFGENGRYRTPADRIAECIDLLLNCGYYRIEHVGTVKTYLMMA